MPISATESRLAQHAAPARSTRLPAPSRAASARRKFFRGEPPSHESNGRTSGQLFLAITCPTANTTRWIALSMGFPAHHPVAVGHAMALRLSTERVTGTVWRQWPQLYPQRTGRCKPWLPYSLCLLYPGIPDIIEVKIETKAKIVVPYHSRYSWELTQIVSSYITDARSTTRRGGGGL